MEQTASNNAKKQHNLLIPNELLNDLSSRFIINVPEEERMDPIRLCFQIELAHWFYLDFYCEENPSLPKINVKDFIHIIFRHIPFLKHCTTTYVDSIISDWREYKKAVPTFGGILLDYELKNVLLVQSFTYKTSWGFPKGKVNKDEQPHHCAIREVLEETGFDITDLLDKEAYLEHYFNDQLIRLYIIPGVSPDAKFHPQTRNEIKKCDWFPVNQLPTGRKDPQPPKMNLSPNNCFMVIPFVKPLKKWIAARSASSQQDKALADKIDADKQFQKQQQIFSQMTKSEFAKFFENPALVDHRNTRASKSYSPPPRMLKQKNAKQPGENDKKKNVHSVSQNENKQFGQSKSHRKAGGESPKVGKTSKELGKGLPEEYKAILSPTWTNFSLDCEALVATFNINLRYSGSF